MNGTDVHVLKFQFGSLKKRKKCNIVVPLHMSRRSSFWTGLSSCSCFIDIYIPDYPGARLSELLTQVQALFFSQVWSLVLFELRIKNDVLFFFQSVSKILTLVFFFFLFSIAPKWYFSEWITLPQCTCKLNTTFTKNTLNNSINKSFFSFPVGRIYQY